MRVFMITRNLKASVLELKSVGHWPIQEQDWVTLSSRIGWPNWKATALQGSDSNLNRSHLSVI